MKKITRDLFYDSNTTIPLRSKISLKFFFSGMFLLFGLAVFAQETKNTAFTDTDTFLSAMRTKDSKKQEFSHLENLLNEINPSIYFYSGQVKSYGENATTLFTDINSVSSIAAADFQKEQIEIATIKISTASDVSKPIDLSAFANFPKLKYIHIISTVRNNPQNIIRSVKNALPVYHVFYTIDLGS